MLSQVLCASSGVAVPVILPEGDHQLSSAVPATGPCCEHVPVVLFLTVRFLDLVRSCPELILDSHKMYFNRPQNPLLLLRSSNLQSPIKPLQKPYKSPFRILEIYVSRPYSGAELSAWEVQTCPLIGLSLLKGGPGQALSPTRGMH